MPTILKALESSGVFLFSCVAARMSLMGVMSDRFAMSARCPLIPRAHIPHGSLSNSGSFSTLAAVRRASPLLSSVHFLDPTTVVCGHRHRIFRAASFDCCP